VNWNYQPPPLSFFCQKGFGGGVWDHYQRAAYRFVAVLVPISNEMTTPRVAWAMGPELQDTDCQRVGGMGS
jgi:hypothetical protein